MSTQQSSTTKHMPALSQLSVLAIGIYLGILFVKSEVAYWHRVHAMFLFQEAHMYLIITVAIATAMVSLLLIKRLEIKTVAGEPIKPPLKSFHKGNIIGGVLFGAGWAITGTCPGPIYAQIGGGQLMALFTFAGAMIGMFSYAALKPRLPH